jgi:hypothetical protein
MKKSIVVLCAVLACIVLASCSPKTAEVAAPVAATPAVVVPSVDTISAASATSYYAASSYDLAKLISVLGAYPYPVSVTIATVNSDGSPNLAVCIPGITKDGKYLTFGLSENRTKANFQERELGVVLFYEYTPTAEKAERNKGCKAVVRYVGDEENTRLNEAAANKNPSLYMEIVDILPIG